VAHKAGVLVAVFNTGLIIVVGHCLHGLASLCG
jgi:hypothetical protein